MKYKSIKLEMIAKNSAKKPINFSATKYFTQSSKKITSFMEYCKAKQKEKEKEVQEKKTQKPKTQKPKARKRSRKAERKVKAEQLVRMV